MNVSSRGPTSTRVRSCRAISRGAYREIDSETLIDLWGTTWKRVPDGHFINVECPIHKVEPTLEVLEGFQ